MYGEYGRDNIPTGLKMPAQGHPLVFNERRENPDNTGQAATGPKILLNTCTAEELPLCNQVT